MKKMSFLVILIWAMMPLMAQTQDLTIGRVTFPHPFIHAGKDFTPGTYYIVLTYKDNVPYFKVHNKKKELLFEELAVIKPNDAKNKNFKHFTRREMLKENEYFRIKITKPDQLIMAYFLTKK